MEVKLGFVGFGEAAFELSTGLRQEGLANIKAYDPMINHHKYGELIQNRAKIADVELQTDLETMVKDINIIVVAVPADKAYEASREIVQFLKKDCVYIDVSASAPKVKQDIFQGIKEQGAGFVDAAMMGSLPVNKQKVPIIASGDGTEKFIELLSPFGMNIKEVSETPGDASAVKLIRSIFMKGVVPLYYEMLEVANAFDVDELVLKSLGKSLDHFSFEENMNRLVTGASIHALRKSVELEGSIEMLESSNIDALMTKAARDKLKLISEYNFKDKFKGETPKSWVQVIEQM